MVSTIYYIQLSYGIPLQIIYTFFTISLFMKLCVWKIKQYDNEFFPFMLVKSIAENVLLLTSMFFEKFYRLGMFPGIYQKFPFIKVILIFETNSTYTLLFSLTLVIAINRYLACSHPVKYKVIFSSEHVKKIIFAMILFALTINIVLHIVGPRKKSTNHDNLALEKSTKNLSIIGIIFVIGFYIPLIILSCVFNFLMILRVRKKDFKKITSKATQSLFYYSIFTLVNFIIILVIIIGKTMDAFLNIFPNEKLVNHVNSIAFELGTYGSFIGSLILSSQLRNIFYSKPSKVQIGEGNGVIKQLGAHYRRHSNMTSRVINQSHINT
uniref:Serpentine receptor class gamma n=1 Tax=Strongyloides venezuelensis TaxID=75913 RepID=A0A0K0FJD5_STRVS